MSLLASITLHGTELFAVFFSSSSCSSFVPLYLGVLFLFLLFFCCNTVREREREEKKRVKSTNFSFLHSHFHTHEKILKEEKKKSFFSLKFDFHRCLLFTEDKKSNNNKKIIIRESTQKKEQYYYFHY